MLSSCCDFSQLQVFVQDRRRSVNKHLFFDNRNTVALFQAYLENLAQWLGLNRQQKFGKSYNVRFYGSSEYHFNYIKHKFDRSDH